MEILNNFNLTYCFIIFVIIEVVMLFILFIITKESKNKVKFYVAKQPGIYGLRLFLGKPKWHENLVWVVDKSYVKDGDFYVTVYNGVSFRRHKSCFVYRECSYTLGTFEYDSDCWNFQFVSDRPLGLNEEEREIFWELLTYGYKELSDGSD